jgi:hypothetical protein
LDVEKKALGYAGTFREKIKISLVKVPNAARKRPSILHE